MKISKKSLEHSQVKYLVTIEGAEWTKLQEKGLSKITANIQLPGFRKGKVPLSIVKDKVSEEEIIQETSSFAADAAYKFMIDKENPQIIMQPELVIEDVDMKKVVLGFIVQHLPKIKLGDYKNLKTKKNKITINKDEIQHQINNILARLATTKTKNDKAVKGDIIVLNFEGFIGEKAFDGGKAQKHNLELGSNSFIPGFEDQLIGVKSQDKRNVEVTFPNDYPDKKLSGKKAIFKCEILEVKTKIVSKFNDAFVKAQKFPKISTVKELENTLKNHIKNQKEKKIEEKYQEELMNELVSTSEINVPPKFIEMETNQLLKNFKENLKTQNSDLEKFKKMTKQTDEQVIQNISKDALRRLQFSFIFDKIAKLEKIKITEKDMEVEANKIAKVYNKKTEDIKKEVDAGQVAYSLKVAKVFAILKNKKG